MGRGEASAGSLSIELFTSPTCVRCPAVKDAIKKIIKDKGLNFEEVVKVRDIKADPEAMTDLLMLNCMNTPTVKVGEKVLTGEITADQIKEAIG